MASSGSKSRSKITKGKEVKFYAVSHGRKNGVFTDWNTCSRSVTGFSKAKYKSYSSLQEAVDVLARNFVTPICVFEGDKCSANDDYCSGNNLKIVINEVKPTEHKSCFIVYTDGSCVNNGKPDAKYSFAIYSKDFDQLNFAFNLQTPKLTNNVAELSGCVMAMKAAIKLQLPSVTICTDSICILNSATMYIDGWEKKNWENVENK